MQWATNNRARGLFVGTLPKSNCHHTATSSIYWLFCLACICSHQLSLYLYALHTDFVITSYFDRVDRAQTGTILNILRDHSGISVSRIYYRYGAECQNLAGRFLSVLFWQFVLKINITALAASATEIIRDLFVYKRKTHIRISIIMESSVIVMNAITLHTNSIKYPCANHHCCNTQWKNSGNTSMRFRHRAQSHTMSFCSCLAC